MRLARIHPHAGEIFVIGMVSLGLLVLLVCASFGRHADPKLAELRQIRHELDLEKADLDATQRDLAAWDATNKTIDSQLQTLRYFQPAVNP
jgi:sensor domain CHASE-containing protein